MNSEKKLELMLQITTRKNPKTVKTITFMSVLKDKAPSASMIRETWRAYNSTGKIIKARLANKQINEANNKEARRKMNPKNRKIQIHKSNSQEKAKISVKVKPKKKRRTISKLIVKKRTTVLNRMQRAIKIRTKKIKRMNSMRLIISIKNLE